MKHEPKNMMTTEQFDLWLKKAPTGDSVVYYKGSLAPDCCKLDAYDKRKLREHVMNVYGTWNVMHEACTIKSNNIIDLYQKMIDKGEAKISNDDKTKNRPAVFEYIAVKL
jgi:hypothetical protein